MTLSLLNNVLDCLESSILLLMDVFAVLFRNDVGVGSTSGSNRAISEGNTVRQGGIWSVVTNSPLGLLTLLLLEFKSFKALFLNTFDLLSHPQELNHLLNIDFGSDVLGNAELVLLVKSTFHLIIPHLILINFSPRQSFLLLLILLCIGKGGVDNGKGKVQQEEGSHQYHDDEE